MQIENLLSKPVWQMTGEELLFLSRQTADTGSHTENIKETPSEKRYVYGIAGICEIFNCSRATAIRIKKSGVIDKAITQVGRKIVIDKDLALQLATAKTMPNKRSGWQNIYSITRGKGKDLPFGDTMRLGDYETLPNGVAALPNYRNTSILPYPNPSIPKLPIIKLSEYEIAQSLSWWGYVTERHGYSDWDNRKLGLL